jgi:hypothetical protein
MMWFSTMSAAANWIPQYSNILRKDGASTALNGCNASTKWQIACPSEADASNPLEEAYINEAGMEGIEAQIQG